MNSVRKRLLSFVRLFLRYLKHYSLGYSYSKYNGVFSSTALRFDNFMLRTSVLETNAQWLGSTPLSYKTLFASSIASSVLVSEWLTWWRQCTADTHGSIPAANVKN